MSVCGLSHLANESLDDPALVRHVLHQLSHVVVRCSDQRRPEHDGEIVHVHLVGVSALHHALQVQAHQPQRLVVVLRQSTDLQHTTGTTTTTSRDRNTRGTTPYAFRQITNFTLQKFDQSMAQNIKLPSSAIDCTGNLRR